MRNTINKMICVVLFVTSFTSVRLVQAQSANIEGKFTNLGVQLTSANLQANLFVQGADGKEYAYAVVRGKPGHLIGYDMELKTVVADIEIKTADGAMDMAASTDHWLYIGASNGHLYRTRPGSQQIEDLGRALPETAEIMEMTAGSDGEVFGGTYPTGKVFRYHPKDGFSDVGKGRMIASENYVRSIAYQHKTGTVYAGVGSHAHLVAVDVKTGKKEEMLPEKYWNQEFIYYMGVAEGLDGGDRLLAWLTSTKERKTLVYNLSTRKIEQIIESLDANAIVKSLNSNQVYFTSMGKLYKNDLTKIGEKSVLLGSCNEAKDMRWGKDGRLHILTKYGEIRKYDPQTSQFIEDKIKVSPQPYGIQTMITGPDGKIWSSGYLFGGNAVYDPVTMKSKQYGGLGQAEGMVNYKNSIYFGIYPKARFYEYDTDKAWDAKGINPRMVGAADEQDRPFATAALTDKEQVYFGTISGYGKLGGALVSYDVKSGKVETFKDVVKDHSVASLYYDKRTVWAGTTIFGGLGAVPTQKEAKLFAWDPDKKSKLFEFVPVPGTMAITCLTNGPDGKIWGLADGVIFIFNPKSRKVEKTHKLFDIPKNPTHIWRVGFLTLHPSGIIYGTANGDFFSVHPKTMKVTVLKKGVGLLAVDAAGILYMRDSENLWSYKP
ncbi:hypothetical protein ABDJ41_15305 [Pedobacter sp. ASV1-7]|uniref:hypothetical protein n=1 Tax=Pedobacter sp. ASV1-7 TaxID=3145237 RepID=UPI0032E88E1E